MPRRTRIFVPACVFEYVLWPPRNWHIRLIRSASSLPHDLRSKSSSLSGCDITNDAASNSMMMIAMYELNGERQIDVNSWVHLHVPGTNENKRSLELIQHYHSPMNITKTILYHSYFSFLNSRNTNILWFNVWVNTSANCEHQRVVFWLPHWLQRRIRPNCLLSYYACSNCPTYVFPCTHFECCGRYH